MQVSSCVSPNYMDRQFDINEKMRAILIDWLIEVWSNLSLFSFSSRQLGCSYQEYTLHAVELSH